MRRAVRPSPLMKLTPAPSFRACQNPANSPIMPSSALAEDSGRRISMTSRGLLVAVLLAVGVLVTLALSPAPAASCPFCNAQGLTLSNEISQAQFVVFGTLSNPKLPADADAISGGTTDLTIEEVVKP